MGWWAEGVMNTWSSELRIWGRSSRDKPCPLTIYLGQCFLLWPFLLTPLAHVHWWHLLLDTIDVVPEDFNIIWIFVNFITAFIKGVLNYSRYCVSDYICSLDLTNLQASKRSTQHMDDDDDMRYGTSEEKMHSSKVWHGVIWKPTPSEMLRGSTIRGSHYAYSSKSFCF